MSPTLKKILRFPNLKDLKVIAGKKGLENEIKTVSVLDAPDGYKWLDGGEFLLTTAWVCIFGLI